MRYVSPRPYLQVAVLGALIATVVSPSALGQALPPAPLPPASQPSDPSVPVPPAPVPAEPVPPAPVPPAPVPAPAGPPPADPVRAAPLPANPVAAGIKVLRSGPLLIHGNYCGIGNRPGKVPIDALDEACMHHDACTKTGTLPSCACDDALRRAATAIAEDPATPPDIQAVAAATASGMALLVCKDKP